MLNDFDFGRPSESLLSTLAHEISPMQICRDFSEAKEQRSDKGEDERQADAQMETNDQTDLHQLHLI